MIGWIERWRHRRHQKLRTIDLECMFTAIVDRATTLDKAHLAWHVFTHSPGQEHWLCACAAPATATLEATFRRLARAKGASTEKWP